MLLLMDATLMRGDDARRIQLCDMFYKLVEQTRPHTGFAFGTVTDQGKVNRVCGMSVTALDPVCEINANSCKATHLRSFENLTWSICRMAERSLHGLSDTEIPFNVASGLLSDGCCGDTSSWISIHTPTCQVASLGKLMQT